MTMRTYHHHGFVSTAAALLLLASPFIIQPAEANVCLMVYQMADNNLEDAIRGDNYELIQSPAIKDKTLTTWVYFDGRNYGTEFEDISEPLRGLYNPDGSEVTTKSVNSIYMTWDHSRDKMILNWTSAGELNSDIPQTVYDFVVTALADCLSKGSTEYMIVFSSHGAGLWGFGGDDNTGMEEGEGGEEEEQPARRRRGRRRSRRRLIQDNADLIGALQSAFTNLSDSGMFENVPTMYDVIGFDACLMQAVDAVDDFRSITKYYLASEATEPGHGWAYKYLDTAESALAMAKNFEKNYIEKSQVLGFLGEWLDIDLTPKTMALVDTSLFTAFLQAWDALCAEFLTLMGTDIDFFTHLYRARNSALAFQGYPDADSSTPSALDIGSFIDQLKMLCGPAEGSQLLTLVQKVEETYAAMFIVRGVGDGTPNATGMHITWPQRRVFENEEDWLYGPLFNTTSDLPTDDAPNFLKFLANYYQASSPLPFADNETKSVCTQSAGAEEVDGLFMLEKNIDVHDAYVDITVVIARSVDEVTIEYGVDITSLLQKEPSRYRRLQRIAEQQQQQQQSHVEEEEERMESLDPSSSPFLHIPNRHRRAAAAMTRSRTERRLQTANETEATTDGGDAPPTFDFFFFYGGDVLGSFFMTSYSGKWDRTCYFLGDETSAEPVYASDYGNGYKSIPVLYYPYVIEKSKIEFLTTIEEAMAYNGSMGYITFSARAGEEISASGLALYTYTDGNTVSETPRAAGGSIVPIIFAEAVVADKMITELVGGFNSTVLPWNNQSQIGVVVMKAVECLQSYGLEEVVIVIAAYDDDNDKNGTEGYADEVYTANITMNELMGIAKPATTKSAAVLPSAFLAATTVIMFLVLTHLF